MTPALVRDGGGVLHVAWHLAPGGLHDVETRTISPRGVLGARQTLAYQWLGAAAPGIAYDATSGTVLVFAGGTPDPQYGVVPGLYYWTSQPDGSTFMRTNTPLGASDGAATSAMQAAATPSAVFQTWASEGVFVHRGMTPSADQRVSPDGSWSTLAYDAARRKLFVMLARVTRGSEGLWVRPIDQATGATAGPMVRLVGSSTVRHGVRRFRAAPMPVPAASLSHHAGIVVAYPTGWPLANTVRVWRVSAGRTVSSVVAGGGPAKDAVAVAADPKGRVWVVWAETGVPKVYARRSNVGATAWGKTLWIKSPLRYGEPIRLAASAQADRLDIVALFPRLQANDLFHAQLLP